MTEMTEANTVRCPYAGTNNCKGHKFSRGGNDLGCANRPMCTKYENGCSPDTLHSCEVVTFRCPLVGETWIGKVCSSGNGCACGWYGISNIKKE